MLTQKKRPHCLIMARDTKKPLHSLSDLFLSFQHIVYKKTRGTIFIVSHRCKGLDVQATLLLLFELALKRKTSRC